ncbi:branched-chain amino acid transport system permease protein [Aquamicrobium terrae]
MQQLFELVFSGAVNGAIYGAVALALVIIHRGTAIPNFAQGEMATFCTLIAWSMLQWGVPYWLALILTIVFAFVFGALIELLIIRRFEGGNPANAIVVCLGLYGALNGLGQFIWGGDVKTFPSFFSTSPVEVLGLHISPIYVGTFAILGVLMLAVWLLFQHTHLGLTMRAAAQQRTSSALIGIEVGRTLMFGWGIASAIGAIAGMLVAPLTFLEPQMMAWVLLYAFAAAVLGGFDSAPGAVLGGILIGIAENCVGVYAPFVGNDLKLPAVLLLIVLVILIRPQGLLGHQQVKRV